MTRFPHSRRSEPGNHPESEHRRISSRVFRVPRHGCRTPASHHQDGRPRVTMGSVACGRLVTPAGETRPGPRARTPSGGRLALRAGEGAGNAAWGRRAPLRSPASTTSRGRTDPCAGWGSQAGLSAFCANARTRYPVAMAVVRPAKRRQTLRLLQDAGLLPAGYTDSLRPHHPQAPPTLRPRHSGLERDPDIITHFRLEAPGERASLTYPLSSGPGTFETIVRRGEPSVHTVPGRKSILEFLRDVEAGRIDGPGLGTSGSLPDGKCVLPVLCHHVKVPGSHRCIAFFR